MINKGRSVGKFKCLIGVLNGGLCNSFNKREYSGLEADGEKELESAVV